MQDLELITFSELIDKLTVINIKLYHLLDKTAEIDRKAEKTADEIALIVMLSGENIRLVKQRSNLKSAIDKKLNIAINNGGTEILDEVKNYSR
jgi:hypothetical protein